VKKEKVKMFPKKDALKMGFKTQEQALEWACRKHKFGGCFEEEETLHNGERIYVAYWLPSNHPQLSNFAW
jgi:hypothetical protein